MSDSWDDYANEWESNPDVISYAEHAFNSLTNSVTLSGKRVLDFGCGTGLLTEKLSRTANEVVSLDPSQKMIDVLARKGLDRVITVASELTPELVSTHPSFQSPFDVIVASSALAFVPEFETTLSLLHSLLAPQGQLVQWDWLKNDADTGMGFSETELLNAYQAQGFADVTVSVPFSMSSPKGTMSVVMGVAAKQ